MGVEAPRPSLTHMVDKLALAAGGRPEFLFTWASPWNCLSVLMAWYSFPRVRNPKKWSIIVFYDLASEVTHDHFCNILLVT